MGWGDAEAADAACSQFLDSFILMRALALVLLACSAKIESSTPQASSLFARGRDGILKSNRIFYRAMYDKKSHAF